MGEVAALDQPFYLPETTASAYAGIAEHALPLPLRAGARSPAAVVAGLARSGATASPGPGWRRPSCAWPRPPPARRGRPARRIRDRVAVGESIGIQGSIDPTVSATLLRGGEDYQRIKRKIRPGWDVAVTVRGASDRPRCCRWTPTRATGLMTPPGPPPCEPRRLPAGLRGAAARIRRPRRARRVGSPAGYPDLPRRVTDQPGRGHTHHPGPGHRCLPQREPQVHPGGWGRRRPTGPRGMPAARDPVVVRGDVGVRYRPRTRSRVGRAARLHRPGRRVPGRGALPPRSGRPTYEVDGQSCITAPTTPGGGSLSRRGG